jgi:hypothetical protein
MSNRGPIITPDFARKIAQLSFAGHEMDNLSEGLQPFAMVVVDHRSIQARTTMDHVRRTAEDYDLVTAGKTNTSLTDARSLRGTNVIHIDFDSVHAEARVDATLITLDAILGDDHTFAWALQQMWNRYTADRLVYQRRIEAHCRINPYACFLRAIQLRIVNWFRSMMSALVMPPPPNFAEILDRMDIEDPSWVPTIPLKYLFAAPSVPRPAPVAAPCANPVPAPHAVPAPRAAPAAATPNRLVRTTVIPDIATEFGSKIANSTVTAAIERGGTLISVVREDRTISMCGRWHLAGVCRADCRRSANHGTHTDTEHTTLLTWCRVAYA